MYTPYMSTIFIIEVFINLGKNVAFNVSMYVQELVVNRRKKLVNSNRKNLIKPYLLGNQNCTQVLLYTFYKPYRTHCLLINV